MYFNPDCITIQQTLATDLFFIVRNFLSGFNSENKDSERKFFKVEDNKIKKRGHTKDIIDKKKERREINILKEN